MEQLLDFENEKFKNKVYKLNKALHGLKQASKSWYEKIDQYLQSQTLKHCKYYYNLYYLVENNEIVILIIYVHVFFVIENHIEKISLLKEQLKSRFEMANLAHVKRYLRIEFKYL
jgi:hypothetical protein